jgi:cbb3-type cytochrome oxidase subunit 3
VELLWLLVTGGLVFLISKAPSPAPPLAHFLFFLFSALVCAAPVWWYYRRGGKEELADERRRRFLQDTERPGGPRGPRRPPW